MKKIAILLCLIMSLLTVFVSCRGGDDSTNSATPAESEQPVNPDSGNGGSTGDNDNVIEYSGELAVNTASFKQFKKVYNENHSFSYKTTGTYIVKNGKTSYKVVVPEVETQAISYAKSELSRFFKEATGVDLKFVTDKGLTHNDTNRYISLGDTSLYRSLGRNDNIAALKKDGTKIFTKGKSVYIIGGEETGVLNGVYDFLKINFGFEYFFTDGYTLRTGVTDLKLLDYDVTDISDIEYRQRIGYMAGSSDTTDGKMISYRLRLRDSYGDLLLPIHMGDTNTTEIKNNHNSLYFVPEAKYGKTNPEFYSGAGQLCYTAHGNSKNTYDTMTTICAEKIEQSLMWYPAAEYPQYKAVLLGQMDNVPMCKCTDCMRMKSEHNDANSAALMKFMHDVGKKVDAWMALEENAAYRRENFKYMFFAYLDTSRPPFGEDADGNIKIADDLKFDDGVNVAPFFAQSHLHTGVSFDDNANIEQKEYIRLWGKEYPGTWAWSYGTFYNDFFTFWDLYSFYPGYYKYLKANNYSLTFPQIKSGQTGADTGFNVLAIYMYSKLSWNSELSVENIFNEYFNAMYAEAAEPMREMFDDLRLWFARCLTENNWAWSANMNGSISGSMEFVKQGDLATMFRHLNEAYSKIEMYKKDTAKYASLKSHIDMEWLFPAKVVISCDTGLFKENEIAEIKTNFKTYVRTLGITQIKEFTSIEPFINSL